MLEFARWKYILAALVLLASAFYAMPNLFPQDPAVQISANRGEVDAAVKSRIEALLKANGIVPRRVAIEDGNLLVRLANPDDQLKASDLIRPELDSRYTSALNLASTVPSWLSKLGAKPMTLGLDLQGGVHFLMEVDQAAALDKRMNAYAEEIRGLLREGEVRNAAIARSGKGIRVELKDANEARTALNLLTPILGRLQITESDDGKILMVQASEAETKAIFDGAIDQNITTLRNRIDSLGVAEPVIQRQGSNRIIVQLPGVQDTAEAKDIIGATATLEYRAVIGGYAEA